MRREDELLEEARRLTVAERRRLAERLLQEINNDASAPSDDVLDELLKLEGIGHSDFTDVSSDKYRHLAEAYSSK
jgi:hypothetical protein